MPVLPSTITPYYGGGQVQNPANVIPTSGVPPSRFTEDKLGTIAVDNGAQNSYMLVSKSGGVDTWAEIGSSSGSVTEVEGTMHQIDTVTSGSLVTVSLNDGISLGSYQADSPPVGGMIIPGQVSVGSPTPNAYAALDVTQSSGYGVTIGGVTSGVDGSNTNCGVVVQTTVSPSANNSNCYSYAAFTDFGTFSDNTVPIAANFYGNHISDSNLGTINLAAVFYADSGISFVGSYGFVYGAYIKDQTASEFSHMALYTDNASVGNSTATPPVNGLLVSGASGFGTSTVDPSAIVSVSSTTQGFLPPSMTTDQKNSIPSPAAGLVVYDNSLNNLSYYNGSTWVNLS